MDSQVSYFLRDWASIHNTTNHPVLSLLLVLFSKYQASICFNRLGGGTRQYCRNTVAQAMQCHVKSQASASDIHPNVAVRSA